MTIWEVLGIDATGDVRDVKRAYARKLKVTRPEDDPTAFQLLNDAFQHALAYAEHRAEHRAELAVESTAAQADAAPVAPPLPHTAVPTGRLEAVPPPAVRSPSRPSPAAAAQALWAAFVKIGTVQPRMRLAKMAASEALLNMDVREQFELCAVRHGASAACSDEWREAMFQHFGWENDHALIVRELPDESSTLFARLRAQRAWLHVLQQHRGNPALDALTAERPRHAWLKTSDGGFMKKMRLLLAEITTHHPELLDYRLDQDLVRYWQGHVERKRYYLQTALFPIIAGLVLTMMCISSLPNLGVPAKVVSYLALAELPATVIGTALYAFNLPRLRRWLASQRMRYLLGEVRLRPQWQFGWLLPFALVSPLLFVPDPAPWLRYLVDTALLACTAAALFANAGLLQIWLIIFGAGGAIAFGNTVQGVLAHDAMARMLAGFCAMLVLIRGGGQLLPMTGIPFRWVTPLRCTWMAGSVALVWFAQWAGQHAAAYAAMTWLWLFVGMLMCYLTAQFYFAVGGCFILRTIVIDFLPQPGILLTQPMSLLLGGLLMVTLFMIFNMWQVLRHKHLF